MKTNIKRVGALTVAVCLGMSSFTFAEDIPAYCDEAFYITADAYGKIKESSVVKGYYVNGATKITDYGSYENITNMTNTTEGQISGDAVTFDFGENSPNRFYFEGKTEMPMKNVPWDISVSYKLNGVPKKADELAGENGLVEINLDIIPNKQAEKYYRNNFVLTAATVVNSDEVLSIKAEGAQIQSAGNMKAIMFMALPGEEQHFTLSIGTDDFSFAGWTFIMMPATFDQLKQINDLRELKEKTEDSADAISDSLDIILDTMGSLSSSCSSITAGLNSLDVARQIVANGKGQVYADTDASLANLQKLSEDLAPLDADLQNATSALNDLNAEYNSIYTYVLDISDNLKDLENCSSSISEDLGTIKDWIEEENGTVEKYQEALTRVENNLIHLKKNVSDMSMYLYNLHGALDDMTDAADRMSLTYLTGNLDPYIAAFAGSDPGSSVILSTLKELQTYMNNISALVDVLGPRISSLSSNSSDLCESLSFAADNGNNLIDSLADLTGLMNNSLDRYNEHKDEITDLIGSTQEAVDALNKAMETSRNIISAGDDIRDTVNENHPNLLQSIEDGREIINTTIDNTTSLYKFCSDFESLLKTSGTQLNDGMAKSIAALTDALAKTVTGLDQTGVIKDAKDTVKDLIDDEWDKNTGEETNLLETDAEADKVSFTSSLNPSPNSLQILMRTEEITTDDDDVDKDVDEDFHAEGNVFSRIASIFKKIFSTIASIFS